MVTQNYYYSLKKNVDFSFFCYIFCSHVPFAIDIQDL